MNKLAAIFMLAFSIISISSTSMAKESTWKPKPNPSWLMLQSMEMPAKEYPTLKVWGLVDAVYSFDNTDQLVPNNTASLRRGYIGIRGAWMQNIDYFVLSDFGTGVAGRTPPLLLDASLTLSTSPILRSGLVNSRFPLV